MASELFEVVLSGTMGGQEIINRWNYNADVNTPDPLGAFGLLTAMGLVPSAGVFPTGTIGDAIADLTSNGLEWNQALCRSIYDPFDFIDTPYVPHVPGNQSGDVEAMFVAIGFRTNRVRTDIGRGYKRFAGVNESLVNSFGELTSTAISLANVLAGLMGDVLSFTDSSLTNTYTPVIVKKQMYTTPPSPKAYRYYPTYAEQADFLAQGVTWENYTTVRSQVSRQIGKGR